MQIQKIQSSNNQHIPNFEAKFKCDTSGYFYGLWGSASKREDFYSVAHRFSILGNSKTIYEIIERNIVDNNYNFKVLNHETKQLETYTFQLAKNADILPSLMREIIAERCVHKEDADTNYTRSCETIKAKYFYNDPNGYFSELFSESTMTEKEVENKLQNLNRADGGINLHIYKKGNINTCLFDEKTGKSLGRFDCVYYNMFNHATSQNIINIEIPIDTKDKLAYMLDILNKDYNKYDFIKHADYRYFQMLADRDNIPVQS